MHGGVSPPRLSWRIHLLFGPVFRGRKRLIFPLPNGNNGIL